MGWRYNQVQGERPLPLEVNGEELESAARAVEVLVCLRGGRGADLLRAQGWAISPGERWQAVKLFREHSVPSYR